MAANPSSACDPITSWYGFSYFLSWSDDCEVAQILSDIPFISVGILVLGVSMLFFVLKRVTLPAIWLFSSALLAFISAVVDLGKTLADEVTGSITLAASEPAIRAREILFALSVGFRFLFYWSYVAEPPRKDLSAASSQWFQSTRFSTLKFSREVHSGSWTRWGLPGKLFAVGLLAGIVTIVALQITWRVVPQVHQYGTVYATDAVLELLLSFLLLLKVLLNTITANSPDSMLVHTFRECLAPIVGLLINIAIGVGALLSFAFTESTAGRVLQAFEVCVIVVFVVFVALLRHRDTLLAGTASQTKRRRDIVFTLPEPVRGSTFRVTTPQVETPRLSMIFGAVTQNMGPSREVLRRSARCSLNFVSSWVSSKVSRNRSRHGEDMVKLWNAKKGKVDPPYTGSIGTEMRTSIVSLTQGSRGWGEFVREVAPANHLPIISALDAQSAIARSMAGSIHSGRMLQPSQVDVPQCTILPPAQMGPISVSSHSSSTPTGAKRGRNMVTPPQDSPIYGLGGIQTHTNASASRTSLDELLRQQSQLDQSMEALRMFSGRASTDSHAILSRKSAELSRSPSTGQRTVSDVSLSTFPIPPWSTTPGPSLPSSPRLSTIRRIRGNRRIQLAQAAAWTAPIHDTYPSPPPKTPASFADIPSSPHVSSIPHSPFGEENESFSVGPGMLPRFDSGGTHYNVTSFIGGLATPAEPRQGNYEPHWHCRESGSSVGTILNGSEAKKVPTRMLPVPGRVGGQSMPTRPAMARLMPLVPSSISSLGDDLDEPTGGLIDDQTTCSSTIDLSLPTTATEDAEKGMSMPVSAQRAEQRIVTRPRPSPLTIEAYAERNHRKPSGQVLAED